MDAFRRGESPPQQVETPPEFDSALMAARARAHASHLAYTVLSTEHNGLAADAAKAAARVRVIIDDIVAADARALAAEWIAATRTCWELQDRLTGVARIGEVIPHDEQTRILEQIDRRKVAIADNRLMIEDHNWRGHLDGLSAKQEEYWLDYRRRLTNDPAATFDGEDPPR